jgi:FkbM family methyltransferase
MLGFIKRMFRKFGIEISFLTVQSKPRYNFLKIIENHNIDLIYDVGANVGQFGSEMREVGYNGYIVSFEPLPLEHKVLLNKSKEDVKWKVHEQCAIGNENTFIDIHVSGNSVSSSILPMADAHSDAAESSAYVNKIRVPLRKLDTVFDTYSTLSKNYFIKIDTQGYEWQVLDGASEILKNATGVQVELSLVQLYEGQKLWIDIIQRLESAGFYLWQLQPGFTDPRNGRLLQCDGIFIKG